MNDIKSDSYPFIELLATPNLRSSNLKMLEVFSFVGDSYDTLLLNYPEEMEEKLLKLGHEQLTLEEFMEHIIECEIIPEPVTSWIYTAQPVLETLPRLRAGFPHLKIQCYGSKEAETSQMDVSSTFALLTLRTMITGRVDHDSWREAVTKSHRVNFERVLDESERIQSKYGDSSACITDMSPSLLAKTLREGASVRVCYIEKPYHFTPLVVLRRKMTIGSLTDGELEELINLHVDYVRNYIYIFRSRDRAHYEWVLDNVSWPKLELDREEVSLLDNLIL